MISITSGSLVFIIICCVLAAAIYTKIAVAVDRLTRKEDDE